MQSLIGITGISFYRLTVWTAIFVSNDKVELILVDVNGIAHNLTKENVNKLLGFGWVFYTLAIIFNLIYYMIHPSSPASIKQRLRCRKDRISSEDLNDSADEEKRSKPVTSRFLLDNPHLTYRSCEDSSSDDSEDDNDKETEF